MLRKCLAVAMSTALVLLPLTSLAAVSTGRIEGKVTVEGQPLMGLGLALIELKSGQIHRVKSSKDGSFKLDVAPGEYVLTNQGLAGLSVGRAPARVVVVAGRVALAELELMKLPVVYQEPQAGAQQAGAIQHDAVGCMVAGQFPLIEAVIQPAASVARARVYFKSALGPDYYFVEAVQVAATETVPVHFSGKLPKPQLKASPITYYIQATTTEFGESQTAEIQALVVADESECPEGKKVAPIGPAGAVTVFSAASAAPVAAVGFAAGGAVALGTVAAVVLGAGAAAIGAKQLTEETTTTTSTTTTSTTTTTTTSSTSTTSTTSTSSTSTTTIPFCLNVTPAQPQPCKCLTKNPATPSGCTVVP